MVTLPVAAGALAYLMLVFLPAKRQIDDLRAETQQKERFVAQSTTVMPVMHATQEELGRAEQFTAAWSEHSPNPTSRSQLYGAIQELANAAGVRTIRFNPETVDTYEAICKIPLAVTFAGSFEQVFAFLRSVEELPLTIWTDAVNIEKLDKGDGDLACEVRFVVFADNPEISD